MFKNFVCWNLLVEGVRGLADREDVCMLHSGQCEAIGTLKRNESDIFKRLHELEKMVWKAAGMTGIISGIVTAILVGVIQKVLHG